MTDSPTVFVVDDNPSVRRSLQTLGESEGLRVATFASAEEFLDSFDPAHPGCLVLDVRLRHANGLDVQSEVRKRGGTLPILVITGYADVPTSVRAFREGALDFLQKPVPPPVMIARIRQAIEADTQARAEAFAREDLNDRIRHLTPREREVMHLMATGESSKAIAEALKISVRTIEGHRRAVLAKMGVETAAHLARAVALLGH